jgi:hypothetical protein
MSARQGSRRKKPMVSGSGNPIVEAIATVPLTIGGEAPLDVIFQSAEEIAVKDNWNEHFSVAAVRAALCPALRRLKLARDR